MQAEGKGNIDRIRESNINTDETFMNVAEMITIIAAHTLLAHDLFNHVLFFISLLFYIEFLVVVTINNFFPHNL